MTALTNSKLNQTDTRAPDSLAECPHLKKSRAVGYIVFPSRPGSAHLPYPDHLDGENLL